MKKVILGEIFGLFFMIGMMWGGVYLFFNFFDNNSCSGFTGKLFLQCKSIPVIQPFVIFMSCFFIYDSLNILYQAIKRQMAASRYKRFKLKERQEREAKNK